MEKNIKLVDFVERYSKCTNDTAREKYVKDNLKVEKYISYVTKINEANRIVRSTSYTAKEKTDENGAKTVLPDKIRISSAIRYAMTMHKMIELYTNIETDMEKFLDEFDMVNQNGLLEVILNQIGEKEKQEFMTVVSMCFDDFLANNYETKAFITSQVERIGDLANVLLAPIVEKIVNMDEKDNDKLVKSADKLSRKFQVVK